MLDLIRVLRVNAEMARPVKLPITRTPSGNWSYELPAKLSPTGKRQLKTFKTKLLADIARDGELERHKLYGIEGHAIDASLAIDAAKAYDIIKDCNTTLYAVALEWKRRDDERKASCTLEELYQRYRKLKAAAVSDAYLRDIDKFFQLILPFLGNRIVAHLDPKEIRQTLHECFETPRQFANAYRTIRPAFSFAVQEDLASQNPFDKIAISKVTKAGTQVLSLAQVKKLLNSCSDFTKDEQMPKSYQMDCTSALPAFCLMLFAGVRPEETKRLKWSNIHLDDRVIVIDGQISKTRSHRIIPMSENLYHWLKDYEPEEREISVTPSNWRIRYAAVRYASGLRKLQQDILRHSFASYHLASHSDIRALQEAMGHGSSEMILKHYKALIRKPDAIKFWTLQPSAENENLRAV
jgi:integrase